ERLVLARARGVDGAGDELLPRAGFAGDEHRGVGGGDAADLGEHVRQCRAAADDLLEIMDRFDLLLEVTVLLLQAVALLLRQRPVRDVDTDTQAVLNTAVGTAGGHHPHLEPHGSAVLVSTLSLPPGDGLARLVRTSHYLAPGSPVRGLRREEVSMLSDDF